MRWPWSKKHEPVVGPVQVGSPSVGELNELSPTWVFIDQWAEKEITRIRESNDSLTADMARTFYMRGQIEALKRLRYLPKEKRVNGLLHPDHE